MDVDAFVAAHRAEWRRLEYLIAHRRQLSGAEADELVDLYQRVATHLSMIRSATPDPALVSRLSQLVARARSAVTGAHSPAWRDAARLLTVTFPAVAYRYRWWWLGTSLIWVFLATMIGFWVATNGQVQAALAGENVQQLVNQDFENYYSAHPAGSFAAQVWTNNAWIAAVALAFGVLLGLPTLYVLWINLVNLGGTGGIMFAYGQGDLFFGLILPHGLLELTAVLLAGAVGLRLGWTVIDPGPHPRAQALAEEGRAAVSIAIGLVLVLLISGGIEAFVTPSPLPTAARIGIGVVAELAFIAYVVVVGRRAVRAGETGDLLPGERPDTVPVSA